MQLFWPELANDISTLFQPRRRERVSIAQLRSSWRPFLVSLTMMLLLQTSGLLVLVYYAVSIFQVRLFLPDADNTDICDEKLNLSVCKVLIFQIHVSVLKDLGMIVHSTIKNATDRTTIDPILLAEITLVDYIPPKNPSLMKMNYKATRVIKSCF